MPLTVVSKLTQWNEILAYTKPDYDVGLKSKKGKSDATKTPQTPPTPSPAASSKSKSKRAIPVETVKEEIHSEVEATEYYNLEDVVMTDSDDEDHLVLKQKCQECLGQGHVYLHLYKTTGHFLWKCNYPRCRLKWTSILEEIELAKDTVLCPQCQKSDMLKHQPNPDEPEIYECTDLGCLCAFPVSDLKQVMAQVNYDVNRTHSVLPWSRRVQPYGVHQ